jgi:peptidoglycan/xylan/chitin deacetylase (PgdA/CDA1 family)
MNDRHQWMKRMTIGLFGLCLLLTGYLFFYQKTAAWNEKKEQVLYWLTETKEQEKKEGKEEKKIALTFDDGPHPVYTPMLLEGLEKREVKATFFLMGTAVENYPEIVRQMADDGHLIGNHTYHHVSLENADASLIETEVLSANNLIESVSGQYPQFIRPPFGQSSREIEEETGMICVLWTIDPLDWCTPDAAKIVQRVLANAGENDIILLHDEYKTSVMAAFTIIDTLQKEGYEFVTVDELLLD